MRQRVKDKPIKGCFKINSQCDSEHYRYRFEIYQSLRLCEKHVAQAGRSTADTVFEPGIPLKDRGYIITFVWLFYSIALVDRLHDIGLNTVERINKSREDQPILFESYLKKTTSSAELVLTIPTKQYLCCTKPRPFDLFLIIKARICLRWSASRKTSTRKKT